MTDHFVDTTKMVSLNPLPELVYRLRDEAPYGNLDGGTKRELHLIDASYRAGADQELEACCEWLDNEIGAVDPDDLRAERRPKPPSLKEQAMKELEILSDYAHGLGCDGSTIRQVLEALPND